MDTNEALDLLEGGQVHIYDTPIGLKLSIKSPEAAEWTYTDEEELEAANHLMHKYEDTITAAFHASENHDEEALVRDQIGRLLAEDDEHACTVLGRADNIPLSEDEARAARAEHVDE